MTLLYNFQYTVQVHEVDKPRPADLVIKHNTGIACPHTILSILTLIKTVPTTFTTPLIISVNNDKLAIETGLRKGISISKKDNDFDSDKFVRNSEKSQP